MKTSEAGINLIKKYEGLRLKAYKAVPTEKWYTIGYGHYAKDVTKDMQITEEQATEFLRQDLRTAERAVSAVNDRKEMGLTQNEFDALVSFTFNCGVGNLEKLTAKRSRIQIGEAITLYNKAGGKVLNGLVKRREEEKRMYFGR